MSSSIPAQPPPPDYGNANKTAIETDISTLPLRNQINQAAQLGQRIEYQDPVTGATKVADFTGMGNAAASAQAAQILGQTNADMQRQQLALRQELGVGNVQQTIKELQAADPQGYALRQSLTQQAQQGLGQSPEYSASPNLASAENRLWNIANSAPGSDSARLDSLYNAAGGQLDTRNALGALSRGVAANDGSARLGSLASDAQRSLTPRLGSIYDDATRLPTEFRDQNAEVLSPAMQRVLAEFELGGKLNDKEMRDVTNNARAGQAARGNYLGDAAAVQEGVEQGLAGNDRAQQRFHNLLDIQGQAFGQSDALRNEGQSAKLSRIGTLSGLEGQRYGMEQGRIGTLAGLESQRFGQGSTTNAQLAALQNQGYAQNQGRIGTMANLAGQQFNQGQQAYSTGLNAAQAAFGGTAAMANDQRQAQQLNFAQQQQRLANASAIALGAPVTNQFGSLGGAQNGAVGFTPVNYQPVGQLNQNAGQQGANFAQQNFGTLSNMWGKQADIASQGNPWMSALGTIGGAALGAMI
jgi:hypothetical protein